MYQVPEQVKNALRSGNYSNNYIIEVLKEDGTVDFIIDNNNLVDESVSIDERMSSGDELKFGLSEGSYLEFQYFDLHNIRGRELKLYIDCQYRDGELKWYRIPLGQFTVDSCATQANTGIIKANCYNKLLSKYLDNKANDLISDIQSDTTEQDKISMYALQSVLLEEYQIQPKQEVIFYPFEKEYDNYQTFLNNETNERSLGSKLIDSLQYNFAVFFHKLHVEGLDPQKQTHICGVDKYIEFAKKTFNGFMEWLEKEYPPAYYDTQGIKKRFLSSDVYLKYTGITVTFEDGTFGCYVVDDSGNLPSYSGINTNIKLKGKLEKLKYIKGITAVDIHFYTAFTHYYPAVSYRRGWLEDDSTQYPWKVVENTGYEKIYVVQTEVDELDNYLLNKNDIPDVTLRQLVSSNYELRCQYGKIDRATNMFSGYELNNKSLQPRDTLSPSNNLVPSGSSETTFARIYEKLWTDTMGEKNFRYLIVTYKGIGDDGNETEKKMQRTINTDGTTDYNMSDNWLFKNIVWNDEDISKYIDDMAEKMRNIKWIPFEMWCAGLPYLETGDKLEIKTNIGTFHSYILNRQLKGIQDLKDTYINGKLDVF